MADELTGRALDDAAAKAMGWTDIQPGMGEIPMDGLRPRCRRHEIVPFFSTDFAALPESLAHLHRAGWCISIDIGDPNHGAECRVLAWRGDSNERHEAFGAALPEAIARLVVAVSKRKEADRG